MKKYVTLVLSFILLLSVAIAKDESSLSQGESVALTVTRNLNKGKIEEALALFHPEALESMKSMMIHIAKTPNSPNDQSRLFQEMGVKSLKELENANPQKIALAVMKMVEEKKAPKVKVIMSVAEYEVVGSVSEKDMEHVILRVRAQLLDKKTNNIVAVSVKKHGDKWLYLGTGKLPF